MTKDDEDDEQKQSKKASKTNPTAREEANKTQDATMTTQSSADHDNLDADDATVATEKSQEQDPESDMAQRVANPESGQVDGGHGDSISIKVKGEQPFSCQEVEMDHSSDINNQQAEVGDENRTGDRDDDATRDESNNLEPNGQLVASQREQEVEDEEQEDSSQQAQHQVQVPASADYLSQLIKDKKQLASFPFAFDHVDRLLDEEIHKVRQSLFQLSEFISLHNNNNNNTNSHNQNNRMDTNGQLSVPLDSNNSPPMHLFEELPEPDGSELVQLQEKLYVPVDEHPEYNFVGRLLGPRGMTAKQLEGDTGCKIMIRGRGSMRDKKKEEQNRGKANWEHLNDDLHVLVTVEDTQSRAQVKMRRAIDEVKKLLVPVVDGEDELKKRQLMELAIINGTYRDCNYNDALSKMLNDAVYRQKLAPDALAGHQSPSAGNPSHNHHAHHNHNSQRQPQAPALAPPSQQQQQHYNPNGYSNGTLCQIPMSMSSSGVASTGSNTPNSVQSQQQPAGGHHPGRPNHGGPAHSPVDHRAASPSGRHAHGGAPTHMAAAAAAAAQLAIAAASGDPTGAPNMIAYPGHPGHPHAAPPPGQYHHDFHHYAATMAAVAAAAASSPHHHPHAHAHPHHPIHAHHHMHGGHAPHQLGHHHQHQHQQQMQLAIAAAAAAGDYPAAALAHAMAASGHAHLSPLGHPHAHHGSPYHHQALLVADHFAQQQHQHQHHHNHHHEQQQQHQQQQQQHQQQQQQHSDQQQDNGNTQMPVEESNLQEEHGDLSQNEQSQQQQQQQLAH